MMASQRDILGFIINYDWCRNSSQSDLEINPKSFVEMLHSALRYYWTWFWNKNFLWWPRFINRHFFCCLSRYYHLVQLLSIRYSLGCFLPNTTYAISHLLWRWFFNYDNLLYLRWRYFHFILCLSLFSSFLLFMLLVHFHQQYFIYFYQFQYWFLRKLLNCLIIFSRLIVQLSIVRDTTCDNSKAAYLSLGPFFHIKNIFLI